MKNMILISGCALAIFANGCSSPPQHSTASPEPAPPPKASGEATTAKAAATSWEGSWNGRSVTPDHEGAATLKVSGNKVEYHGDDADDWLKGTFTLNESASPMQFTGVITDCGDSQQIGKKNYAIYKLEGDTLTVTGANLDASTFPESFDAPQTQKFIFKRTQ